MADQLVISLEESQQFAILSGDTNPLHLDPVVARRTLFQGTVSHGVHVLLAALDKWTAQAGPQNVVIADIAAHFLSPVRTGEPFFIAVRQQGTVVDIHVTTTSQPALSGVLTLAPAAPSAPDWIGDAAPPCEQPLLLDFPAATQAVGEVGLVVDRRTLATLFPNLAKWGDLVAVATLLAATRIVGVKCPGYFSIFTGLQFKWDRQTPIVCRSISFAVSQASQSKSLLRIGIQGDGMKGSLGCIFRPSPVQQISFQLARECVAPNQFSKRRCLVIGGSRGLGEIAVKLLAAGDADVRMTYHQGEDDAKVICREITDAGYRLASFAFDITNPAIKATWANDGWRPSHVYFFATPAILPSKDRNWDEEKFTNFCSYFIVGPARILTWILDNLGVAPDDFTICQPSTKFIDEPNVAYSEYSAAKAAAEIALAGLTSRRKIKRLIIPRMSRVLTDQTNSIIPHRLQSGVEVLLPMLSE
jgi:acyl dehydratase